MDLRKVFSAHDATTGTPWKRVAELAVPILIGSIAQQLYNTVDTVVVGRYIGDDALSAVGAAGPITNMLMIFFVGLSTGAGILVAQRYGAKDKDSLGKTIGNLLLMGVLVAAFTAALGLFLITVPIFGGRTLMQVMNTPEGNIYIWCRQYLIVAFAGVLGTAIYNLSASILRGMGDSVSALAFLVFTCLLNIVLDIWFVAGFGLGVFGVSLATVISQTVSAVLCLIKLFRMKQEFILDAAAFKPDRQIITRSLALGIPSGITQSVVSLSSIMVQALINSMGTTVMACNVVVGRVNGLASLPAFALGNAMTTYAGQNYGARKLDRLEKGSLQGVGIAAVISVTLVAIVLAFGRPLMGIFTETEELIELSVKMQRILAFSFIVLSMNQTMQGFLKGVGYPQIPMWTSIFTQIVLRMPLAYLFASWTATPEFPNGQAKAIFISQVCGWCANGLINTIQYIRIRDRLRKTPAEQWK